MKKQIYILIGYFLFYIPVFAGNKAPGILGEGFPGGKNEGESVNIGENFGNISIGKASTDFVVTFIKYIAIIAVISLMLGGIMYILSGGEEEKAKKAKSWIIWSLVGVFMSVSAWGIITFITQLSI